jgi:hypothetical protein
MYVKKTNKACEKPQNCLQLYTIYGLFPFCLPPLEPIA